MKPITLSTLERPVTPHSQFRDQAPERRVLPIRLDLLEVNTTNLTITMRCSPGFLRVAQQRYGHRPGVPLNVYHVDFQQDPRDSTTWIGSTHPESTPSLRSTEEAAEALLSLLRSQLVFDKVFEAVGSYDKWVHDHQGRTPSHQEVIQLAKERRCGVPYLVLPFRGLDDNLDRIRRARLAEAHPRRSGTQKPPEKERIQQTAALCRSGTLHLPVKR